MSNDDRREHQRLRLAKPILATFRRENALILDIGIAGAFIEHYGAASPGETHTLSFRWQGNTVKFVARVAHSTVIRRPGGDGRSEVSHTGLAFVEEVADGATQLQHLIATFATRIMEAQEANVSGARDEAEGGAALARLGEARRIRSRGFISYRLKDNTWWKLPTESPKQPEDGFTVGIYEDLDELESLCRTYESSDEEGRRLIRMIAELSLLKSP
jgi:hypothetical protein